MLRVKWQYPIFVLIVLLSGGWQAPPSKLPTAQEIDSILKELSGITGFRIRKQLPFALITRDEVNKYVQEQIRDTVKPDEIRAEEATLKKFGFAEGEYGRSPDDGFRLIDCRITNAVRCVPPENKPIPAEIAGCRPFLTAEIASLPRLEAVLALGAIAHGSLLAALYPALSESFH